ncbi:MAG: uroporphyrinogen decarboxylase family protein [Acidobacteriota bacterium]
MSSVSEQDKTPEELRREREQRITDAIRLMSTDRIPVSCELGYFAARYAGKPCSAAYYDYDGWLNAYRKTLTDFKPDMAFVREFTPGHALELLDPKFMKWPGYGLDPDVGFQAIEIECLQEEEYDLFLNSPADYLIRHHLPRLHGSLGFLSKLPQLADIGWIEPWSAQNLAMFVTEPDIAEAIRNLQEAGRELRKWQTRAKEFENLLMEFGIPRLYQGGALPPFDIMSHSVRGMKGTMLDMYRRPDKLLEACDFILRKTLERPLPPPNEYGNLRMFMTNTRGSDDFMSMEQFRTFYWPGFKKLVLTLIERGATPCIFLEGNFTSRLEYLLEFPRGKFLIRLDTTDIFRAKEVLKDHCCIEGNVPSSLLQVGSVQDIKDYCKKLIDVVGEGGGYILGPRSSTDEVKPENLKTMIEFTREYGRY